MIYVFIFICASLPTFFSMNKNNDNIDTNAILVPICTTNTTKTETTTKWRRRRRSQLCQSVDRSHSQAEYTSAFLLTQYSNIHTYTHIYKYIYTNIPCGQAEIHINNINNMHEIYIVLWNYQLSMGPYLTTTSQCIRPFLSVGIAQVILDCFAKRTILQHQTVLYVFIIQGWQSNVF